MKLGLLLGGIFGVINVSASADEVKNQGWFAGLGIGASSYEAEESLDTSDTVLTGFGGYRFNKHLAVQGNVVDLGKYEGDGGVLNSVDLSGFSFTANGILPLGSNGVELYGRLGLAALKYTQKFDLLGSELENSSTGDAIVSSVGFSYTPPTFQKATFQIEYINYYFETEKTYSDGEAESNNLGVFQVGAKFNF